MQSDALWTTSPDHLIRLFRETLRALVPFIEKAKIPWREPNAYDDWDDMSEAIYRSIIIRPLGFADEVGPSLPIPGYGFLQSTYANNSFLSDVDLAGSAAFVCFETRLEPFDQAYFAILDESLNVVGERRLAMADTKFVFCRRIDANVPADVIDTSKIRS